MTYPDRQAVYRQIEQNRDTKVLSFITGTRRGLETMIAVDCIDQFVDLLEQVGPTTRISLILHTNGGQTLAAWQLVNLIRMFCDDLEVVVPMRALSAGTLIAIGADRVIMTKQATLGPIDPSVNNPLNPTVNIKGEDHRVSVSVENVRGYLDVARKELEIRGEKALSSILRNLSGHIHPLVLGEIFRSRTQIRFLAEKLLPRQVGDKEKIKSISDFLCGDSGSHDYTINRREASELGLNVEKPSDSLYKLLRRVQISYTQELKLMEPHVPAALLGNAKPNVPVPYSLPRAFVEGTIGGCYSFVSEGNVTAVKAANAAPGQVTLQDNRTFEGWKKWA